MIYANGFSSVPTTAAHPRPRAQESSGEPRDTAHLSAGEAEWAPPTRQQMAQVTLGGKVSSVWGALHQAGYSDREIGAQGLVQQVARLNHLRDPGQVHSGQTLQMPLPLTGKPAPAAAAAARGGNRDQEMLARAIAAESRGESHESQVAVAQTIANHARLHKQTVPGLVRSSFLSSNFDGNKRFYTLKPSRIPHWDQYYAAAGEALAGRSPVGSKRQYFHDTSIGAPAWVNKQTAVQVGHLVFYEERAPRTAERHRHVPHSAGARRQPGVSPGGGRQSG